MRKPGSGLLLGRGSGFTNHKELQANGLSARYLHSLLTTKAISAQPDKDRRRGVFYCSSTSGDRNWYYLGYYTFVHFSTVKGIYLIATRCGLVLFVQFLDLQVTPYLQP